MSIELITTKDKQCLAIIDREIIQIPGKDFGGVGNLTVGQRTKKKPFNWNGNIRIYLNSPDAWNEISNSKRFAVYIMFRKRNTGRFEIEIIR